MDSSHNKKLYLETWGCQMNVHDSEKASHLLEELGYEPTSDPAAADLVLLNTCMVREKAARKVYSRIGNIRNGPRQIIGVMGCVAQAEAERVFERSPEVRLVLGTQSIGKLPELVAQLESGFHRAIDVRLSKDADFVEMAPEKRRAGSVAFITITEGCDKFCSYCIVPFTRGRERSRPVSSIVAEAKALASQGVKEVQLLGQNVNSYGLSSRRISKTADLTGNDSEWATFAGLLDRVASESGLRRIKFTTSYPKDFTADIVNVIEKHTNLCEWIHLPAQSGSDRILRLMRRGYTRRDYLDRISYIKQSTKDISITGDFIIGFPGETEDDFAQTLELAAEVEYDGLYIFNYSPRPHTPAAAFADTVPDNIKAERFARLQEIQRRIQSRRYSRYLGMVVEVLVEGVSARSDQDLTGHARCHKVVNFRGGRAAIGDIVNIKVTELRANSLYGEQV
jgi:tRNA-2-methylthio-N6-dimethylallyladenosine synthase